jgi:HPt (histidine-containing phosphotransfer) domain-containing protein
VSAAEQPAAVFDRNLALQQLGGDEELLDEIEVMFLARSPEDWRVLEEQAAGKHLDVVYRMAHTLKGNAGTLGAAPLRAAAAALEACSRQGSDHGLDKELAEVLEQWRVLCAALKSAREVRGAA